MACRGCSSDGCSCSVTGVGPVSVTGSGTPITSPYIVAFSMPTALAALTVDNVTACDVLNDPHVPVRLGDGSVISVPLPCFDPLETPVAGQAFSFTWNSTIDTTPPDANIQFNNASYPLTTIIYVSDFEYYGTNVGTWLAALDDLTGSPKGMFKLYLRTDPTKWVIFRLSSVTNGTAGVKNVTVAYVAHNGALSGAVPGNLVLDFAPASEGSLGGFNSVQTIRTVTGADSLVLIDAGKYLRCGNVSPFSLTVPLNATVAYTIGTHIDLIQTLAGQVTIAATVGVTINATPGLKLNGQWAGATLVKVGTDEWDLVGNLTS